MKNESNRTTNKRIDMQCDIVNNPDIEYCNFSPSKILCDKSRKNQGNLIKALDKPTFIKGKLVSTCPQKKPYKEPTHLAQKHAPWNDLHQRYTLSSSRHEVYHYDPQVNF